MAQECLDPKEVNAFAHVAKYGLSGKGSTRGFLKNMAKKCLTYRDGFKCGPKAEDKALHGHWFLLPGEGRAPPYEWDPLSPIEHTVDDLWQGLDS